MTYSIRYATDNDKENSWENRKVSMVKLLQHYQPEIFGIQEGLNHQIELYTSTIKGPTTISFPTICLFWLKCNFKENLSPG